MNILKTLHDVFWGVNGCPDTDYLTDRVKTLSNELSRCIGVIGITEGYKAIVSPYDIIHNYDMVVADADYLVYNIDDWKAIVSRLHQKLEGKYEWTKSVYDCDDIALLYASTLAYSAYREGFLRQPAFAIAWSRTHAFNLLIDSAKTVWIIEPQNGKFVGRLVHNTNPSYDVKKIWFMS